VRPAAGVRFGPFRLDFANARLWQGDRVCRLTPKALAVLDLLVSRPGRLVAKEEVLGAIWPGVAVSDAALTVCIRELRRVMEDDARQPRFIETVHRRGFRFIGQLTPEIEPVAEGGGESPGTVVSRDAEVATLAGWFARARAGDRQVAFVTGEAGIGKTTLVEAFLASLAGPGEPWVARGQCIAYLGAGEAYLPVLDGIGRLARQPGGEALVPLISRHAPNWLLQMPGLVSAADLEAVWRRVGDASRGRMLREMAEALEAITASRPLVLVLEDLHWSDHATLDLIAWLARGREPARLFVLGTYRPVDAIVQSHPLRSVVLELTRQRRSEQLPLELLSEAAVGRYLAARFPKSAWSPALVHAVHRRTDGNPLFMVTVVDALVQRGWLTETGGGWEARPGAEQAAAEVPATLSEMVGQQFEALGPDHQALLECASTVGLDFSAAAVAAGAGAPIESIEARCAALARRGQFIHSSGSERWPDGTLAGRYRFIHALYQQIVYERLPPGRRAQLHRRIGARLEAAHGDRAAEHAGELARHFLEGHELERALGHLLQAADNAQARAAYREAIVHLTQGLGVIERLPHTDDRDRRELEFETALGLPLMALRGFAAPEVERAYTRARALCEATGDTQHLPSIVWGLWMWHAVRGWAVDARRLADQLMDLAHREPPVAVLAHVAQGLTRYSMGELVVARDHLDRAIAWRDTRPRDTAPAVHGRVPERHRGLARAFGGQHPDVIAHRHGAWTLWALGYPDQARSRAAHALALARELGSPPSIVASIVFLARLHQFVGDPAGTREHADAAAALAREQGFAQRLAAATLLGGWAQVASGLPEGLAAMASGLADFRATGAGDDIPYWLALLAEARLAAGDIEGASRDLDEALAVVEANQLRVWEAEVRRLRGEARLRRSPGDTALAGADFLEALAVARRQEARSHELRAALSLARLWQSTGRRAEARERLGQTYAWFTEGFDTRDLTAARALLDELSTRAAPPRPARRARS
jgi:DNA-binding winged helix-turn-helix (wHTH) protein/predicted ATPase